MVGVDVSSAHVNRVLSSFAINLASVAMRWRGLLCAESDISGDSVANSFVKPILILMLESAQMPFNFSTTDSV